MAFDTVILRTNEKISSWAAVQFHQVCFQNENESKT